MTKLSKLILAILVLFFIWLFSLKKEFEIQNEIIPPANAQIEMVLNFFGSEPEDELIISQNAILSVGIPETPNTSFSEDKSLTTPYMTPQAYQDGEIEEIIRHYARLYGADENLALRIAWCESGFNPQVCNKQFGCVGGQVIYQFIASTWAKNCEGDVFNAEDNIKCGVKLISQGQLSHWGSAETWWGSWACWNK